MVFSAVEQHTTAEQYDRQQATFNIGKRHRSATAHRVVSLLRWIDRSALDASIPSLEQQICPMFAMGFRFHPKHGAFQNEQMKLSGSARTRDLIEPSRLSSCGFPRSRGLREPIADLASGCGAPRDTSCPTIRLVLSFFWKRFLRLATQERVWRWIALEERGSFLDELSQAIDLVCIVGRWPKQFALVTHCSAPLWQAGARRSLSHRRLRAEPQPMISRQ